MLVILIGLFFRQWFTHFCDIYVFLLQFRRKFFFLFSTLISPLTWHTNNRELKEIINESEQVIYKQENLVQSGDKVLGIKWDEEKDQLILDIINPILENMSSDNVTKRTI